MLGYHSYNHVIALYRCLPDTLLCNAIFGWDSFVLPGAFPWPEDEKRFIPIVVQDMPSTGRDRYRISCDDNLHLNVLQCYHIVGAVLFC